AGGLALDDEAAVARCSCDGCCAGGAINFDRKLLEFLARPGCKMGGVEGIFLHDEYFLDQLRLEQPPELRLGPADPGTNFMAEAFELSGCHLRAVPGDRVQFHEVRADGIGPVTNETREVDPAAERR